MFQYRLWKLLGRAEPGVLPCLLPIWSTEQKTSHLEEFLKKKVFAGQQGNSVAPDPSDVAGFNEFMKRYTKGLAIERAAVDNLK